jgi:hypothetical protein
VRQQLPLAAHPFQQRPELCLALTEWGKTR